MEALEAGGEASAAALQRLRGSVRRQAFDAHGCRVVQLALQVADSHTAANLVQELHGHVRQAIGSPHANYVIQKVIEVMPTSLASFIAHELQGNGGLVARHRYGCRILCRLLEHSATDEETVRLVDEVLSESEDLCRHSFARHVMQSILEHGLPAQRKLVASALRNDLLRNARNRNASYVIERALTYCDPSDRRALANELINSEGRRTGGLVALAQNQFGSYVVRALLRQPGDPAWRTKGQLQSAVPQLQRTKYGQRLLEELPQFAAGGG